MKKIFATLALCVMTLAASAQVKSIDIKGDLRHDFGLGVGATFGIVDKIDLAPSFNWYFPEHGHMFTVDADFHYNIDLGKDFTFYPILGAVYFHAEDYNKLGVNIGAGIKYDLNEKIDLFVDGKYQWVDGWDDTYISLGVKIAL